MTPCAKCLGLGSPDFTFAVYRAAESQNKLTANRGKARFKYKSEREWWRKALQARVDEGVVTVATGKRVVRLTRLYTGRQQERDRGNLIGGMKPILDALGPDRTVRGKTTRGTGVIVDDSPKFVADIYEQERSHVSALRIEIWETQQSEARGNG